MIQKIKTPYGTVRVYQRSVAGARGNIMVVPGYGGSISHNKRIVDILADKGYNAFTMSQPRRKGGHDILLRQKVIILSALAAVIPNGEKVHAVAHSLGSASLLRAVQDTPNRFVGLILMQPSGIVGSQKFSDLLRRVGKKTIHNQFSTMKRGNTTTFRQMTRAQLSSGRIIISNLPLALKEARVAITHDITGDIAIVKKLGIPIHVIKANEDELFSISRAGIEYERIVGLAGSYSSIADKNAEHDTFWMNATRTAEIIDVLVQHTY